MQRWKMTAGLMGLSALAVFIAPRLSAVLAPPPAAPPAAPPVVSPPPPAQPSTPTGHLSVDVRLDQSAALADRASERFITIDVIADAAPGTQARRPVDLTVVLDTSGSMNEGKLDQAKRATRHLAEQMGPNDTFSVVTFADRARVIQPAGPADPATLGRVLDRVWDYGGTNLYEGISVGADQIVGRPEAIHRVVVLSDGHPTTGRKTDDSFHRLAGQLAQRGVSVSTVGLGLDFNEDLLASMADLGGGSYDFVSEAVDLTTVFDDELSRTASVIARDTRVALTLPEGIDGLEIIGWTATRSAGGWSVYLGDVAAGSRTRIVAKVQVSPQAAGARTIDATATYSDLIDARRASDADTETLTITSDEVVVRRSVDPNAAAVARRAYGNWYLDMSTRSYADGDQRAEALLEQGRALLLDAVAHDPAAEADLAELESTRSVFESVAPSHPRARQRVKANKERYRAVFR